MPGSISLQADPKDLHNMESPPQDINDKDSEDIDLENQILITSSRSLSEPSHHEDLARVTTAAIIKITVDVLSKAKISVDNKNLIQTEIDSSRSPSRQGRRKWLPKGTNGNVAGRKRHSAGSSRSPKTSGTSSISRARQGFVRRCGKKEMEPSQEKETKICFIGVSERRRIFVRGNVDFPKENILDTLCHQNNLEKKNLKVLFSIKSKEKGKCHWVLETEPSALKQLLRNRKSRLNGHDCRSENFSDRQSATSVVNTAISAATARKKKLAPDAVERTTSERTAIKHITVSIAASSTQNLGKKSTLVMTLQTPTAKPT
ncbi:hypothetical protein AVEN_242366-1 [Araneus ventricosus]|uniref:Uncharacterized protein n=1 Tax=Araneus ventricosus TaxID=182803 RepID=A0A4Y2MN96_ARAVE|nr:hypothetical protein AVEN_242366-1 [Araneus ventricosus]